MVRLKEVSFEDKRKKPVTVKGTRNKKDISFDPVANLVFKEGGSAKPGLWANINRRKKLGISRPKSKSTISKKAYSNMKAGFPKAKGGLARGWGNVMKDKRKITKQY
jgi:hypothetical protein